MSSKRSVMAAAMGMERAFASAQKSPPGQAIMSVSRPMLGVAQLAAAVSVGEVGGEFHLLVRRVARRLAGALERQRHRTVAGDLVGMHVAFSPALERHGRIGRDVQL